jgi:hypothetical protein
MLDYCAVDHELEWRRCFAVAGGGFFDERLEDCALMGIVSVCGVDGSWLEMCMMVSTMMK